MTKSNKPPVTGKTRNAGRGNAPHGLKKIPELKSGPPSKAVKKSDIVPFVDGIFDGDTQATWQVDGKPPHASSGAQNDYFGWYEFGDLPKGLVNEVGAGGDRLSIVPDTGNRIEVGLNNAVSGMIAFRKCYAGS